MANRPDNIKLFGDFAPTVTEAAFNGNPLAKSVCNRAAETIVTSIRLVGACFEGHEVPVALIGAVANSAFFSKRISEALTKTSENNKQYRMVKPAVAPVLGAVLMAMQHSGCEINEQQLANICSAKL